MLETPSAQAGTQSLFLLVWAWHGDSEPRTTWGNYGLWIRPTAAARHSVAQESSSSVVKLCPFYMS